MADVMSFPNTFDEFAEQYKIVDDKKIYTNGTELIPIFRVKQWLEDRKVITNFDRIKAMSLEEMADNIFCRPFCALTKGEECLRWRKSGDCREHAKEWLESEVQEDDR